MNIDLILSSPASIVYLGSEFFDCRFLERQPQNVQFEAKILNFSILSWLLVTIVIHSFGWFLRFLKMGQYCPQSTHQPPTWDAFERPRMTGLREMGGSYFSSSSFLWDRQFLQIVLLEQRLKFSSYWISIYVSLSVKCNEN